MLLWMRDIRMILVAKKIHDTSMLFRKALDEMRFIVVTAMSGDQALMLLSNTPLTALLIDCDALSPADGGLSL